MCDTLVVVRPDCVLFAKNSDRPPSEAQILDWHAASEHPPGSMVSVTHLRIPQVRRTHAVLLSRPSWMWGAEMATNEHGVTIGNEAVFSRYAVPKEGLTGMDLLRLAVERADTAERAVSVILDLIGEFGQGGSCDLHRPSLRYFSSFLVADRHRAFVLETAGPHHAIEEVRGARSISNGLTIPDFAFRHRDLVKTWASRCRVRRARTERRAEIAFDLEDLARALRDHGPVSEQTGSIDYHPLLGGMTGPCMHAGGFAVDSQTTASWIARLSPTSDLHFVTATSAPCTGLFKPVSVHLPLPNTLLGTPKHGRADSTSLFWRHERFQRTVMRNPARFFPLFEAQRNEKERAWFASPPASPEAFQEAHGLLDQWTHLVEQDLHSQPDVVAAAAYPLWTRLFWKLQNRKDHLLCVGE